MDPDLYAAAEKAERLSQDIPFNRSATFAPIIRPTLDVGTTAMVTAATASLSA